MKRFLAITTLLLALLLPFGGIVAAAEDVQTVYPEDSEFVHTLTFEDLTDYSVSEGKYLFAESKAVCLYENGRNLTFSFGGYVTKVDFEDGVAYCTDGETTWSLPGMEECDHAFMEATPTVTAGDYFYYFRGDELKVLNMLEDSAPQTVEGSFTNLKLCGNDVYAVQNSALYKLDGTTATEIVLRYDSFEATANIAIGEARAKLNEFSTPRFVTVEEGAYMTAVNLLSLDGSSFEVLKTVNAPGNTVALLLCYSGNAAIIAMGDASYITLAAKTTPVEIECSEIPSASSATVTSDKIYASPYVIIGVSETSSATGQRVTINAIIKCPDVLAATFYEVETQDGIRGYVAEGFLSEYLFGDNKQPDETPDPHYSESTRTKAMLLILLAVVLVLATIGYVVIILTKKKKRPLNDDYDDRDRLEERERDRREYERERRELERERERDRRELERERREIERERERRGYRDDRDRYDDRRDDRDRYDDRRDDRDRYDDRRDDRDRYDDRRDDKNER